MVKLGIIYLILYYNRFSSTFTYQMLLAFGHSLQKTSLAALAPEPGSHRAVPKASPKSSASGTTQCRSHGDSSKPHGWKIGNINSWIREKNEDIHQ